MLQLAKNQYGCLIRLTPPPPTLLLRGLTLFHMESAARAPSNAFILRRVVSFEVRISRAVSPCYANMDMLESSFLVLHVKA